MKKCSILVVEDEALIAANLVHTLSSLGYTVHKPVATGEDAIRAVKAQKPDLVLMDIQLIGEMDGIEAAAKIRAIADIPLVYLTASTGDLRLKQAQLTEPYGYIVKPAHNRELKATIEMALYKHGLDRKLKVSEENYRKISTMMHLMCDNMPDMIWAKDIEKRYIFANKAICRNLLNAADNNEPTGKNDMFFAERERNRHADNPEWHTFGEICRDTDQITMDAGIPQQFNEYGNVQGKFLFLDVHKAPFIDEQGIMIGTVGSARDVTASKQLEEALAESEASYRGLFNTIRQAIYILNEDGTFLDVNDGAEAMYGYAREEFIGRTPEFLSAPGMNDLAAVIEHIRKAFAGEPQLFEFWGMRRGGEIFPKDVYLYKGMYFGKNVIIAIGSDITERRQAEDALRDLNTYNRSLLEASLDPLVTINSEGKIADVNTSTEKVTGYRREELIGTDFSYYFTEPEQAKEGYQRVFTDGTVRDYPLEIQHRDGKITSVLCNASLYCDESGKVQGVFAAARDITERKRAEEAIHQANKKLTLLSGITRHDINNQLLVLNGFLGFLQRKVTDPTLEDYFTKITNASFRIAAMIQFTKEYEKIGVNAPVWQDCCKLVDTAAKHAPLGKVMVKNDLPSGAEVFADPLVVKVCYNLMDNAARHGGKITTLRFAVEEAGDCHLLVCEDDGNGVFAEDKEKIFERGFGKNTGLGLALSREILAITGITIRETGEPGKGARFEMTVPKGAWRIDPVQ